MLKRSSYLLLCSALLFSACGQKGPLFLPGDMAAGTVVNPEEAAESSTEKSEEKEESTDD